MDKDKTAIKTDHLTKSFGERTAVNNLNIEIFHGEIFSLLGTNGAGKTTTINMLCGLISPTSGDAILNGFGLLESPISIKKVIGVSPQETAIAPHLSTMENLWLMGGICGLKRKQAKDKAKQLMQLLELEDRRDQSRKLSGGLKRRLSIAMALMSDPKILFLDEPTLGLDPHARRLIWNHISEIKEGKTIFLTTHYLEEADALADHIAIIDHGKIIEYGTSSELKERNNSCQVLKITAENIPGEIVTTLNTMGLNVSIEQNCLSIESHNPDFYAIINILRQYNVRIKDIQMKQPSLDEVFLQLTGKEMQNEIS